MNEKKKAVLTEQDLEVLKEKIKPYLTEKRYAHTLSVAKEAVVLGEIYLPEEKKRLMAAALLHDITKRAEVKKQLQYCEKFGIILKSEDLSSSGVLHAITAPALAQRDFSSYVDEEILDAVRWHTTGRDEMTVFEAIIYLADYIEESRTIEDCVAVRRAFYRGLEEKTDPALVLARAMIDSFDSTLSHLSKEGAAIHSDTVGARDYWIRVKNQIEEGTAREEQ